MSKRSTKALVRAALVVLGLSGCIYVHRDDRWPRESWWDRRYRDLLDQFRPPQRIRAPDLRPRSHDPLIQGDTVNISAKVENLGDATSPEFDVVASVTVPGRSPETFQIRFPGLDPAEDYSTFIGGVSIAGIARPVDVSVTLTADPPTPALSNGEVLEWDETNNVRMFTYRVL